MRTFTAVFYLLFFSLTAWGEARSAHAIHSNESLTNLTDLKVVSRQADYFPPLAGAPVSSLRVSQSFEVR